MKRLSVIALLFCLSGLLSPASGQSPLPENFEEWVEENMQTWEIPGMAIAIVDSDSLIYTRGFGVRRLGENEPVDEHTLFGIASITKNMTAAALGILVDEGVIDWDDRVIDHLPWFRLKDRWATEELRIRDLLIHRVGVGRMLGNRLQFMTGESREELLYRMRYQDPEAPFRSRYVYSNVMYTLAGEIVTAVTGQSWDDFLRQRLFEPLGMQRANTSITEISEGENAAWPHQSIRDSVQAIPRRNWDNAAPAGGVNASVYDMASWLRLQLGTPGSFEGQTLISRQVMREIHRPQIALPVNDPYGSQRSYGFGWHIRDHKGYRVLSHGGATDGMNTQAAVIPELDLGIIVVSNVFSWYLEAVVNSVIDARLDMPRRDWSKLYYNQYTIRLEEALERRREIHESRREGTEPTLDTASYSGIYRHDLYGQAEVRLSGGGLEIRFWQDAELIADLEHWHYNTWRMNWRNPAMREEFLHFTIGVDGTVATLEYEVVLRPLLLQAGAYPSDYTRNISMKRVSD